METIYNYGRRTSFSKHIVNDIDLVVLLLASGPLTLKHIKRVLMSRREVCSPHYLFSGEYNFVSKSFDDVTSVIQSPFYSFGSNSTPLWYRVKRGVYALNLNGYKRLQKIVLT